MEHQQRALDAYVAQVAANPDTVGVVVIGSVARGTERDDSDVDVYLVVTAEAFAAATAEDRWAWIDRHGLDYPGSYIDVKLADLAYLRTAVRRADDPTRASFAGARAVFSRSEELPALVERISSLGDEVWAERIRSHVAQAHLHGGYFLRQAEEHGDPFLLQHAAVHLTLAAARAALASAHRLMPGPKYIHRLVREIPSPDGFVEAWDAVVAAPGTTTANALIAIIDDWLGRDQTRDESLSVFIRDNELAWLRGTIPAEYF
ncbi:nucleotidyltransferase domain-containing protein [Microbacterium sp. M28]|uniref:nucleotidyltransferase domain-containing protein n=1 Tax=Microbacterium sp. M28 TaxID=2962064 RepID=UPI0021F3D07E|nr:nucleotidyltransferase domain-containing protein [Microbacterium sp. M28]UYO96598.1 nucleotidyltransferase domain-containing protein [Microbacterium sp. M28]